MTPTLSLIALLTIAAPDDGWIELDSLDAWREPTGDWFLAEDVALDPENSRRLIGTGEGDVLINGKTGRTGNLYSKRKFRDLELSLEFLVGERSNSGVKFMGKYEIQIFDNWTVKEPKTGEFWVGGIYPRADDKKGYRYLDEGVKPKENVARRPGEWQTLEVTFRAPNFDAEGKKIRNARIERAVLNGTLVHEDVELKTPTGTAWTSKEIPEGPLFLQGSHGPVAFRNVKVRPLE